MQLIQAKSSSILIYEMYVSDDQIMVNYLRPHIEFDRLSAFNTIPILFELNLSD